MLSLIMSSYHPTNKLTAYLYNKLFLMTVCQVHVILSLKLIAVLLNPLYRKLFKEKGGKGEVCE